MKYYIADIHFGDLKIFNLCWRYNHFNDLAEYERAIIKKWNEIVGEEDEVYILGDVACDDFTGVLDVIRKLKGIKHLIVGNHDLTLLALYKDAGLFASLNDNLLIKDGDALIHLSHYPLMDWMEANRGGYLIYGHIHNKHLPEIKAYYRDKKAFNAGVDVSGYQPRTLQELITLKEESINEPYIN